MDLQAIQQWRRERLAELAKQVGGNAELGRLLGYRDGAYVGQMISGLRPISETTVVKAEGVRHDSLGMSGAVDGSPLTPSMSPGRVNRPLLTRRRP